FTPGVTPRRKDRIVTGSTEFIITRVQRYNGKPHIFIESE
ncbi:ATP-binding protein, partial [Morganella morganii]